MKVTTVKGVSVGKRLAFMFLLKIRIVDSTLDGIRYFSVSGTVPRVDFSRITLTFLIVSLKFL